MGKIFYIMGKSASGKDKIYKNILENNELDLKELVLYTTRPIRHGEEDGKQYFFVNDKELNTLREAGKIIEERSYQTVHGIWTYFTADNGTLDLTANNYAGIGTLESYGQMRQHYGADTVIPVYIEVEDGLRLERALKRERKQPRPRYQELCRRFLADSEDFSEENISRFKIVQRFSNDGTFEDCLKEVEDFIKSML